MPEGECLELRIELCDGERDNELRLLLSSNFGRLLDLESRLREDVLEKGLVEWRSVRDMEGDTLLVLVEGLVLMKRDSEVVGRVKGDRRISGSMRDVIDGADRPLNESTILLRGCVVDGVLIRRSLILSRMELRESPCRVDPVRKLLSGVLTPGLERNLPVAEELLPNLGVYVGRFSRFCSRTDSERRKRDCDSVGVELPKSLDDRELDEGLGISRILLPRDREDSDAEARGLAISRIVCPNGLDEPDDDLGLENRDGVVGREKVGLDGVDRGVGVVGRENVGRDGVDLPNEDRWRKDSLEDSTDDLSRDEELRLLADLERPRDRCASAKSVERSRNIAKIPTYMVIFDCFLFGDMAGLRFHD